MADIFISHVEKDRSVALELAAGIEAAGYSTWYYERDCEPGSSYLVQIYQAIEQCTAVVLVISAQALSSKQVTSEVVVAHESGKHFIPVLHGMTHSDFQHRQAEWRMALAAASSIVIPPEGASSVIPRITAGLKRMGVAPGEARSRRTTVSFFGQEPAGSPVTLPDLGESRNLILKRFSRRTVAVVSTSLAILVSVGALIYSNVYLRREPTRIETAPPNNANESAAPSQADSQSNVSQSPSTQASEPKPTGSLPGNRRRRQTSERSDAGSVPRNASVVAAEASVQNSNRNASAKVSPKPNETPTPGNSNQNFKSIGGFFKKVFGANTNKKPAKDPDKPE